MRKLVIVLTVFTLPLLAIYSSYDGLESGHKTNVIGKLNRFTLGNLGTNSTLQQDNTIILKNISFGCPSFTEISFESLNHSIVKNDQVDKYCTNQIDMPFLKSQE